jgi:predicted TIM-barrel fold metal-dependent hydrolase
MIIDSHVWLSKPEHWGGKGVMDDAMYAAGWAARGLGTKTGLVKGMSAEQMIERMDEAGVDMAVCHASKAPHLNSEVPPSFVAAAVEKYPDRYIGLGSVDLFGGLSALREMEEIVDMGLVGMKISPASSFDMPLNDLSIMPIYEKAEELGMVIFVHTGWSGYFLLKNQHPILLDEVAVRFPDLKLVVVHAGENYYEEVVMMMLKNANMYANTGWWGFLQPVETNVRFLKYAKHFMVLDKVLWGTDNYDCRDDVPFVKSLPAQAAEHNIAPGLPELTDDDIADYMGNNAARLFGVGTG